MNTSLFPPLHRKVSFHVLSLESVIPCSVYSRSPREVESYGSCLFVIGLFHSAQCPPGSFTRLYKTEFLFKVNMTFCFLSNPVLKWANELNTSQENKCKWPTKIRKMISIINYQGNENQNYSEGASYSS